MNTVYATDYKFIVPSYPSPENNSLQFLLLDQFTWSSLSHFWLRISGDLAGLSCTVSEEFQVSSPELYDGWRLFLPTSVVYIHPPSPEKYKRRPESLGASANVSFLRKKFTTFEETLATYFKGHRELQRLLDQLELRLSYLSRALRANPCPGASQISQGLSVSNGDWRRSVFIIPQLHCC